VYLSTRSLWCYWNGLADGRTKNIPTKYNINSFRRHSVFLSSLKNAERVRMGAHSYLPLDNISMGRDVLLTYQLEMFVLLSYFLGVCCLHIPS
jgi:hypothetical protein